LQRRYLHTGDQFGGRPVYVHESKPDTFLHYSIGRWYVGPRVGEWVGSLFVESHSQTPDAAQCHGGQLPPPTVAYRPLSDSELVSKPELVGAGAS
jgi:hypothetical protein